MVRAVFLSLVTLAALSVTADAEAMRCQRRIVSRGDSQARVTRYCGQPVTRTERVVTNATTVFVPGPGGRLVAQSQSVSMRVETWVYNFGRRRLMRELTFHDGVLVRNRTLGYGFDEDSPRRKSK